MLANLLVENQFAYSTRDNEFGFENCGTVVVGYEQDEDFTVKEKVCSLVYGFVQSDDIAPSGEA